MAYAKWPPAGFMPHAPFVQEAMLRLTGGKRRGVRFWGTVAREISNCSSWPLALQARETSSIGHNTIDADRGL